jgi:hypothetical protein
MIKYGNHVSPSQIKLHFNTPTTQHEKDEMPYYGLFIPLAYFYLFLNVNYKYKTLVSNMLPKCG